MQSGLPASLRETGSVDRYIYTAWAGGPSNSRLCGAVSCEVSCLIMLSLMAPRVCTLVLSLNMFLVHSWFESSNLIGPHEVIDFA